MMTAGFYDAAAGIWLLLVPVAALILSAPQFSRALAAWLLAWADAQETARRMRAERHKIYREMYLPDSSVGGEAAAPRTFSEAKS